MLSDHNIICVLCSMYLIILFTRTNGENMLKLNAPAPDFSRHRIVQPIVLHGRTKREISTTRDTSGVHHPEVTMTVPIDGKEYILDLRLNQDLLTGNHALSYQKNGKIVRRKPEKEELDFCHYGGTVRGRPGSWVAVSTCHGVQGVVADGEMLRYIEPVLERHVNAQHYIYDHSDLTTSFKCGTDGLTDTDFLHSHSQLYHKLHNPKDRQKRASADQTYASSTGRVGEPYNANNQTRYVELVLVVDHSQYKANGRNLRTVYHQMKTLTNIINSVYAPLNIFMALVDVVVWNKHDEITIDFSSSATLNSFTEYRKRVLTEHIPHDNAVFITGRRFDKGVLGVAHLHTMCTYASSCGVASYHSSTIGLVAMTIAHEIGHNFGMKHDNDGEEECECPDKKCIMYSSSSAFIPLHWSSCSLKKLTYTFSRGLDYCLRNKPRRLFESSTCGNGFVEPGEQCDCGTMSIKGAYNPCHACCDPATCKLRANATCGAGSCCDLQTCRPKSAGTECRSADRECDLPEYCTGLSGNCPDDVYKMDTTPCGEGRQSAYCVRGACRSHLTQCRLLWGLIGEPSHESCYKANVQGTRDANCGYDFLRKTYTKCKHQDAMCGRLQCTSYSRKLNFGQFSHPRSHTSYIQTMNSIFYCNSVILDTGLNDVDPGLVPDGAKCGKDMMCLNQRCVSVAAEREQFAKRTASDCPSACSGHGVCNSAGHCHCERGFAPPLCAGPGPGGSYDSGPASDPTTLPTFMVVIYIIFLGIVPASVLLLLLVYFLRENGVFRNLRCKCIFNTNKIQKKEEKSHFLNNIDDSLKYNSTNIKIHKVNPHIYANVEDLKRGQKGQDNIVNFPNKNSTNVPSGSPNITQEHIAMFLERKAQMHSDNTSHVNFGNKSSVIASSANRNLHVRTINNVNTIPYRNLLKKPDHNVNSLNNKKENISNDIPSYSNLAFLNKQRQTPLKPKIDIKNNI